MYKECLKCFDDDKDMGCLNLSCIWEVDTNVPDRFKPKNTGVILTYVKTKNSGIKYLLVKKMPNNPTVEILTWAIVYTSSMGINLAWELDKNTYWIGQRDFCNDMLLQTGELNA